MISVVIPVLNEEDGVVQTLREVKKAVESFEHHEIILINDGSQDRTLERVENCGIKGLKIISHAENLGYGKSLYDGICIAEYNCIAIIDGDGSYPAQTIPELYRYYPAYDMVIGQRTGKEYKKGWMKSSMRFFFRFMAEYSTGRKIPDINSGLRIFKKDIFQKFPNFLCVGFSFTTTITLLYSLNQCCIKYVPIAYNERMGASKVRYPRDIFRTLQIIVGAILFFNPIKLFILVGMVDAVFGMVLCILGFLFNVRIFDWIGVLCISSFIPIFCLGLIADQIRQYNTIRIGRK